jgi:hypothetical protein
MDYVYPHSDTWRAKKDPERSTSVQRRIDNAFAAIRMAQSTAAFPRARAILGLDIVARKMSRWQLMDVLYLFGQAHCAEDRRDLGIPLLEDALTLAVELKDAVAIADVGEPLGLACRWIGRYVRAVDVTPPHELGAYRDQAMQRLKDLDARLWVEAAHPD